MATATTRLKVKDPWWRSPLAVAVGLDILGAACFAIAQVIIFSQPHEIPEKGFFAKLVPAVLMLSVVALWSAGGVIAAVALRRQPLRSSTGRWAIRLVILNICLVPLMGLITGVLYILGLPTSQGWAEPLMPIWLLAGLAAMVLALIAPHERSRGALMFPLILGAAALTFMLGEVFSDH
jgi:hypothetical protein